MPPSRLAVRMWESVSQSTSAGSSQVPALSDRSRLLHGGGAFHSINFRYTARHCRNSATCQRRLSVCQTSYNGWPETKSPQTAYPSRVRSSTTLYGAAGRGRLLDGAERQPLHEISLQGGEHHRHRQRCEQGRRHHLI